MRAAHLIIKSRPLLARVLPPEDRTEFLYGEDGSVHVHVGPNADAEPVGAVEQDGRYGCEMTPSVR